MPGVLNDDEDDEDDELTRLSSPPTDSLISATAASEADADESSLRVLVVVAEGEVMAVVMGEKQREEEMARA